MKLVAQVVQRARDAFEAGRTRSIDFREQQLRQLLQMYEENTTEMVEALAKDLRKVSGHNSAVDRTHSFNASASVCSE